MLTFLHLSSSEGMLALDSKTTGEESDHLELVHLGSSLGLTQILDIYIGFSEPTLCSRSTLLANFAQKDNDPNSLCVTENQRLGFCCSK